MTQRGDTDKRKSVMQTVLGWPNGTTGDTGFANGHASTEGRLYGPHPRWKATTQSPGSCTSATVVGDDGQKILLLGNGSE